MNSFLLEKFDLHGLPLANRVVMAPMTRSRATAGHIPTPIMADYYRQRSSAGLLISEAIAVSLQGCGYPNIPGLWNQEQVLAWKQVTDAVHAAGGKIYAQLVHTGRIAHRTLINEQPVSSSALPPQGQVMAADYSMQPYEAPRSLKDTELPGIVEQFRRAASNAKAAGFDGVELHAANGYLLDQFLRDGVNTRSGPYGGSAENRARLLVDVTQAAIAALGEHRVGIRLSPYSSFNSMSDSQPMNTFTKAIALLNQLPLAYLHMLEAYSGPMAADPSLPRVTESIRKIFPGAIIINGGLTQALGESLLSKGVAQLACYGAPFISNPDLVERFRQGKPLAQPDPSTFYGGSEKGYTDYPTSN